MPNGKWQVLNTTGVNGECNILKGNNVSLMGKDKHKTFIITKTLNKM